MSRVSARLISLVLAMVLAAAPMLPTICDWSCTDGMHGSATTGGAHRHTDDASEPDHAMAGHTAAAHDDHGRPANMVGQADDSDSACCSVAIAIVPQCCDHADSHVVSIAAARIAIEPPAMTPTVFAVSDQLAVSVSSGAVTPIARPPVPLSLLTPLRV